MPQTTRAIVISTVKYGDSGLIVKCFTQSFGIKSYILKGVLSARKNKIRPAYFQPFSILYITAHHRINDNLHYISDVKIAVPLPSVHTHILKLSIGLFLSEIVRQSIREEEKNEPLFQFLEDSLLKLEQHDVSPNFHLMFMLQLSRYLGFYPDATTISKPYFNLSEGTFEDNTSSYSVATNSKSIFKKLFHLNYNTIGQLNFTKEERQQCLELLILYYKLHIQGFKTPKSLLVLRELFK